MLVNVQASKLLSITILVLMSKCDQVSRAKHKTNSSTNSMMGLQVSVKFSGQ